MANVKISALEQDSRQALQGVTLEQRNVRNHGATEGGDAGLQIQNCINEGPGEVWLPAGDWQTGQRLDVPNGVHLHLSKGATLTARDNIDLIKLLDGGRVEGGTLTQSFGTSYTGALLLLYSNGTERYNVTGTLSEKMVFQSNGQAGVGIHLFADVSDDVNSSAIFQTMHHKHWFRGLETAIKMTCRESAAQTTGSFVNGNNIADIYVANSVENVIETVEEQVGGAATPVIAGNYILGIQHQVSGTWTKRGLKTSPRFNRNQVEYFMWDWNHAEPVLEMTNAQTNLNQANNINIIGIYQGAPIQYVAGNSDIIHIGNELQDLS